MALTDEQLVDLVNTEFQNSLGAPSHEVSQDRAKAWEYYNSERFDDDTEEEGESSVVTSDVSDVVDGIIPSLLRMFTTADNLVSFDAVGTEDEQQAEQESDYVSYVFFKQNPAFLILFTWFMDALIQINGITKAWWDESEEITQESYEGLNEADLSELFDDEELEPVERETRTETILVPQVVPGPNGQPALQQVKQEVTVHDITFKRVRQTGRVRVDNIPPEEYRISNDSRSMNPSEARMVGHERMVTRDELLAMGFDKKIVKGLSAESENQQDSPEKVARRDKSDDKTTATNIDKSQDQFKLREAFIRVDIEQNGRSELQQIFTVASTLLEKSGADRQPFHVICPHPLPHKHFGRSTAQKVMDLQRVGSELWRQMLSNLYRTNKPGHAVWELGMGENTMDDLLTTRVGRVARFRRPINDSYKEMTIPFTAAASFPMVEYLDKVKRDRTGVSADSEGLSPEALKNIQTSVLAQAQDISKMKIEAIARIFAETGMKDLFLHIRELVMKHQQQEDIVKLRGKFVPVKPKTWRNRRDTTVNIGLGIGTREQNLLHLENIWTKQAAMVQGGGANVTITAQNMYQTAKEMVKNANLRNPDMFFKDPGDAEIPPPGGDEAAKLQAKEQKLEERRQQLDGVKQQNDQAKLQLQAQKEGLDHQRAMMKLQFDAQQLQMSMGLENQKLQGALAKIQSELQSADFTNRLAGAKGAEEIRKIVAEATKIRAETALILEEVDSQAIENAATESGLTELVDAETSETE